jgi:formate hydrogenlyase transcriptional activator
LNVFPIVLPPLRSRRDDIPLLAHHFVQKFARRMNKEVSQIPEDIMDMLCKYDWPGNVRELQNVTERAVIMSPGPNLRLSSLAPGAPVDGGVAMPIHALEEAERELIVNVLRQVQGVVGGPAGAAARLGLPRTTLLYRMRKLRIIPEKKAATGAQAVNLRSEDTSASVWLAGGEIKGI